MAKAPTVIVVGAGIVGASIAWHLAVARARVVVVDAADAGGTATGRSFAWVNASWGNPEPYFRLRVRSMAEWRRLAAAVPDIPITWAGGLCWNLPPEQLIAYARQHSAWGYGVRQVGRAEAALIEPNLAMPPELALHVAEEAAVEPDDAARALLRDAAARGADLRPGTAVLSLEMRNGKVVGVVTSHGIVAGDEVVLAAGTGTAGLLAKHGFALPMDSPPGLLVHMRPHARLLNGVVLAPELHVRQTVKSRIVIGSDFGGADPGSDAAATAQALSARAKAMLTGGGDLQLDYFTIGYRPTPAGGFPVIGRPDCQAALYIVVMHSGVTLAPAVGLFAAQELLSGHRDPLLMPFGPPSAELQHSAAALDQG